MATTCPTTEAALQTGLLPAQERRADSISGRLNASASPAQALRQAYRKGFGKPATNVSKSASTKVLQARQPGLKSLPKPPVQTAICHAGGFRLNKRINPLGIRP